MPLKKSSGVVAQKSEYDANAKDLASVTEKPVVTDESAGNVNDTKALDSQVMDQIKETGEQVSEAVAERVVEASRASTTNVEAERHEEPESRNTAARSTDVAVKSESTAVATASPSGGMGQRMDELSKEGFEGLELGFGAFPTIVLNSEGQMQTGDGKVLGDSFFGTVDASKQKFLVKNTKCEKRDEDFFYVFDQNWANNQNALDSQGRNAHEKIKEWEGKGWGYEVKKYLDLCVILTTAATTPAGEIILDEGDMVLAQIPKTSIARFSGYAARLGLNGLRSQPTKFMVGQKITGVDYPYYPWDFRKA